MKLKLIKANMTELDLGELKPYHSYKVLFSYETPVAYKELGPEGTSYYRTSTKYSKTTTKHINSWLPNDQAEEVDQSELDNLVK